MAALLLQPLPDRNLPWTDPTTGKPLPPFADFMQTLSKLGILVNGNALGPLVNAANDAAAAAAGVPIGGLYRNVGAVQIRLV